MNDNVHWIITLVVMLAWMFGTAYVDVRLRRRDRQAENDRHWADGYDQGTRDGCDHGDES